MGSNRGGFVCLQTDTSVPSLLQLVARSLYTSNRCLPAGLVSNERLCQPSMESDRQGVLSQIQSKEVRVILKAPVWKIQSWYPVLLGWLTEPPTSYHTPSRCQGPRICAPSWPHGTSQVGTLRPKPFGESYGVGLKSWRSKMNKSYDSLFGRWSHWCDRRGLDPISGPVNEVENFLSELHEDGLQ